MVDPSVRGADAAREPTDAGLAALVAQLHRDGQLTGGMLVHAVCMGHLAFFRHGLAAAAEVPLDRVDAALAAPDQIAALWSKAGLAIGLLSGLDAALAALKGCEAARPTALLAEIIAGPGVPVSIH